jgi:hypothetical protein
LPVLSFLSVRDEITFKIQFLWIPVCGVGLEVLAGGEMVVYRIVRFVVFCGGEEILFKFCLTQVQRLPVGERGAVTANRVIAPFAYYPLL